jgi:hypothetical protein
MRGLITARKGMGWVDDEAQDLDFSLTFTDSFLGRYVPLVLDATGNPLPPPDQRKQIKMPLVVLKAAAWFFALPVTGRKRHRKHSVAPLGYMLGQFSQCVPVRVMFGFVSTSCRRLVVNNRTTLRWGERIFDHVTRGRVRRVQVGWDLPCSCAPPLTCWVFDTHCSRHWLTCKRVAPQRSSFILNPKPSSGCGCRPP